MIYHGGGVFDKPESDGEEEQFFLNDEGCCRVCGKPMYTGGGEAYDADGVLAAVFPADFEKTCDCGFKDLDKDDVYPWIVIDEYGQKLMEWLQDYPGMEWIDEYDICRLSEAVGKTFKELLTYEAGNLIMWHVKAYTDYMRWIVNSGRYSRSHKNGKG